MSVSNYQNAKHLLTEYSKTYKKNWPTDKPRIREYINNYVDYLSKDYKLSEYERNLLSNYACKLHPKD